MYKDVYVFVEQRDGIIQKVGYELLGEAASLAEDLGASVVAVLLGENIEQQAKKLVYYGADKVLYAEHSLLKEFMTLPYTRVIADIIKQNNPEIMLFGATSIGRDVAPRVAARVKTGLTADCTALCIESGTKLLRMTRPAFGGNLMAVIQCKTGRPQMATVRPGTMSALEPDETRRGELVRVEPMLRDEDMRVKLLETVKKEKTVKDITQAKYIVSGGRGMGSPVGFAMLQTLAEHMGAMVAGSRAAADAGWIDKEYQVGQTGKTVRPNLYFALGISGAIQHVAGMENSDFILAINKNETAPIFDVSDLGIVGDVHAIVPKLIQALKTAKEAGLKYVVPTVEFMGFSNVLYEVRSGIAYLTINRPAQLNALNEKTLKEIAAVADMLKDDLSVSVLVVRGAGGRAFAAGADIAAMKGMSPQESAALSRCAQDAFTKLTALPQIVIAAIDGYALGGGNELAMACDIRIASSRAKFGQPEVNLGLIPGFTGTQKLPKLVGKGAAKKLIFTTERIAAEEALRIGLVNQVVAPESLMRTVQGIAQQIMSKSMYAVRQAKKAIEGGARVDLRDGLKIETECWTDCFGEYGEAQEGIDAYVNKRQPRFRDF